MILALSFDMIMTKKKILKYIMQLLKLNPKAKILIIIFLSKSNQKIIILTIAATKKEIAIRIEITIATEIDTEIEITIEIEIAIETGIEMEIDIEIAIETGIEIETETTIETETRIETEIKVQNGSPVTKKKNWMLSPSDTKSMMLEFPE